MKTFKPITIVTVFIFGVAIAISGSMYAAFMVNTKDPSKSTVTIPVQVPVSTIPPKAQAPIITTKPIITTAPTVAPARTQEQRINDLEATVRMLTARVQLLERK